MLHNLCDLLSTLLGGGACIRLPTGNARSTPLCRLCCGTAWSRSWLLGTTGGTCGCGTDMSLSRLKLSRLILASKTHPATPQESVCSMMQLQERFRVTFGPNMHIRWLLHSMTGPGWAPREVLCGGMLL